MSMQTWDRDQAISHIGKMWEEMEKLRAENKRLKTPFGAIQATESLKSGKWTPRLVESDSGWNQILSDYKSDIESAARNDIVNNNNQSLVNNLRKIIAGSGFPETRSEWTGRKYKSVANEWSKCIFTVSGEGSSVLEKRMKEYQALRDQYEKKAAEQKEKSIAEEKRKEAARIANVEFIDLCRHFEIDPTKSDTSDLREAILSKSKYLRLAVSGSETRNDWSGGCYRVESALSEFDISDVVDKCIHDEWRSICDDFEDGRSFRDCEWNYDRIFDLVDDSLLKLWRRFESIEGVIQ